MSCSARALRQRGLTMIEVLIATIILSLLVAMSSWLVWSSSKTVTSNEIQLQSENQAREFLTNLQKELHNSKMEKVEVVDWTSIPAYTAAVLTPPYPPQGNAMAKVPSTFQPGSDGSIRSNAGTPPGQYYTGVVPYHAIRFRIPGKAMDLNKNTANWDADNTNFNLAAYKAVGNYDVTYTTEIMYWFEIDGSNANGKGLSAGEGKAGNGAGGLVGDGVDNNGNGVIDEGVIKRMETIYDQSGNVTARHLATVVRDVAWDPANNAQNAGGAVTGAPSFVWMFFNTDPAGQVYTPGSEKRIFVTLTIEKQDPQHPGKTNYNFKKTVSTFIELRGM